MGIEIKCTARFGDQSSSGKAKLESAAVQFRGEFSFNIPISEILDVKSRKGWLDLTSKQGPAALELGPAEAEKWALKIKYPKPVLDKLGVKNDSTVLLVDIDDKQFVSDLRKRTDSVFVGRHKGLVDLIFWRVVAPKDLTRLPVLRKQMNVNGALWVVAPKGRQDIKESHVFAAGKQYGMVDTKVVSFSDTYTAHKMVIPVADR